MAPITQASDESTHAALLEKLDFQNVRRPFRNPNWGSAQRRNKNVKQIISEASRKEASVLATQNNSGTSTPLPEGSQVVTGAAPRFGVDGAPQPTIAQAAGNLSALAQERNAQNGIPSMSAITYTNIESAPSLHPSSQRHYCDVTGLPAPYTDPKTRLRYHNGEVYGVVRTLGQHPTESYLAARGAFTVLK